MNLKTKLLLGTFLILGLFSQISNFSVMHAEGDTPVANSPKSPDQTTEENKKESTVSAAPIGPASSSRVEAVKRPRSPSPDDVNQKLIDDITNMVEHSSRTMSNKELCKLIKFLNAGLHKHHNIVIDESKDPVTIVEAAVIKNRTYVLRSLLRRIKPLTQPEIEYFTNLAHKHCSPRALSVLQEFK